MLTADGVPLSEGNNMEKIQSPQTGHGPTEDPGDGELRERLKTVIEFIETHLHGLPKISAIARQCDMTARSLQREFHRINWLPVRRR